MRAVRRHARPDTSERHPRFPAAASGTRAPRPSRKEERRVLRAAEGLEMLIFYLILYLSIDLILSLPGFFRSSSPHAVVSVVSILQKKWYCAVLDCRLRVAREWAPCLACLALTASHLCAPSVAAEADLRDQGLPADGAEEGRQMCAAALQLHRRLNRGCLRAAGYPAVALRSSKTMSSFVLPGRLLAALSEVLPAGCAAVKIKKSKDVVKFKVRCSKYLYTLCVKDLEKADKLKQSLPPGLTVKDI